MTNPASGPAASPRLVARASDSADASFRCKRVRLLKFPLIPDARGNLMFAEFPSHLPFVPKRFFTTYDVPVGSVRGEHAHKELEQIIVCLKGSMVVTVDDGTVSEQCLLDSPGAGLYLPPMTWGVQSGHSADCIMLVLASDVYDERGYLRNYPAFLDCLAEKKQSRTVSN
jgi:UDP-2-acetamido-3-amino-2,3-dideoxy-glucuronate N-acetyltransferase